VSIVLRAPAYQALADALRSQITSGRLRPGDRLPTEPQLCRSAGVSRSTVREALRLLASEHLVVTVRGVAGGSFVVHPSPAQLADSLCIGVSLWQATGALGVAELLEVRTMLEVPATRLAAMRRTERDLEMIRATLFDPYTATVDDMLAAHHAFHTAIAAACANPMLELVTLPLHAAVDRSMIDPLERDFWIRVDADHREILAAVTAQRPDDAQAAAEEHMREVHRVFIGSAATPEVETAAVSAVGGA
jgi:GntR family transcriptional repressor for pyruvate dehydrogenase complex